ncbi:MAG: DUF5717 family protein, partial [Clostridiales bacterium]|nr:DUF5717 family protein [Clostridiales bacterium]
LTYTEDDVKYFPRILFGRELDPVYQSEMALEMVRFSQTHDDGGLIEKYLSQADFAQMPQSVRRYMMQALSDMRGYDLLYRLVQEFGMDQLAPAARVSLLTDRLINVEGAQDEADEYLLLLAQNTFFGKKYNDVILSYLCRFYDGPTERMKTLWRAARQFDADTMELEERILTQAIYAGELPALSKDIFDSYYNSRGRDLIVLAYVTACSHDYFVKEIPMEQDVLDLIEARCRTGQELNDACKLALLRSFADKGDKAPLALEEELLAEYTRRNMDFAFFKDLNRSLVKKYHLYDRVFLEYRTDPRAHVVLHYSRDEDGEEFVREDMPDLYDGIFVRQFVLFFGESMQYYISEEKGNKVEVTKSSRLSNADVYIQEDGSRYSLLNQILISQTLQENEAVSRGMKEYARLDKVTKNEFSLL